MPMTPFGRGERAPAATVKRCGQLSLPVMRYNALSLVAAYSALHISITLQKHDAVVVSGTRVGKMDDRQQWLQTTEEHIVRHIPWTAGPYTNRGAAIAIFLSSAIDTPSAIRAVRPPLPVWQAKGGGALVVRNHRQYFKLI